MKIINYISAAAFGLMAFGLASCENGDQSFPDFDGGTSVYFARQYPVRALVLGRDMYDNSADNQHKLFVYSTMGGSYSGQDITVNVAVDDRLCDNLYFEDGVTKILPLPSAYYKLVNNKAAYGGTMWGKFEVQLTDAFFADPKTVNETYVLPLVMTGQTGAGKILSGEVANEGETPARTDVEGWKTQPKDYILYCIKYMNPWHASYLRRGIDNVTESGETFVDIRHKATVEKDEICAITTKSLTEAKFPISVKTKNGISIFCDLLLTFNGDNCTISSETEGVTATGTGRFVADGEKLAWGNKDRDALYLEYNIDFGAQQVATKDTLVLQTRGTNKLVLYTPKYIKN